MSKEADAVALVKSAKKHTTKTITKWKLDWDTAATEYEKAAQIYMNVGKVKEATETWELASNAHDKAGNTFFAGQSLEKCANFLKDNTQEPEAIPKLFVRASQFYAADNKPDRQADALNKAFRHAPPTQLKESLQWLSEGLEALEEAGKFFLCGDLYRSLVMAQIRAQMFPEAIQSLKRQFPALEKLNQPGNAAKAALEIVVICLHIGDWVLAQREFTELQTTATGFAHSKEQACAYDLLSAIEDRDENRLAEIRKDQTFSFLIVDCARMVKKLTVSGGNAPAKAGASGVAAGGGNRTPSESGSESEDLR